MVEAAVAMFVLGNINITEVLIFALPLFSQSFPERLDLLEGFLPGGRKVFIVIGQRGEDVLLSKIGSYQQL